MTNYSHVAEALSKASSSNDEDGVRRLLFETADHLVLTGDADAVIAAGHQFPHLLKDPQVAERIGLAKLVTGDWHGSAAAFQPHTAGDGLLPAGLAWRAGLSAFLQGDIRAADKLFSRGKRSDAYDTDCALLLAWSAIVQLDLGDVEHARWLADEALLIATSETGSTALAICHAVISQLAAHCGDWRAASAHHSAAFGAATRLGDVPTLIRLSLNRGISLAAQCAPEQAIEALTRTLEQIEETGYRAFRPRTLHEIGLALARSGRHDKALEQLLAARTAYETLNSRGSGLPATAIGLVYRRQGDVSRARAAFEEAAGSAVAGGDLQTLSIAKAGLARVRAADDLSEAAALADAAISISDGAGHLEGLIARGWIALLAGQTDDALIYARRVTELATRRRDPASLAESLELKACASSDAPASLLADASAIWSDLRDPLGVARTALLQARLRSDRAGFLEHARALRDIGVHSDWTGMADALAMTRLSPAVQIDALGKFQVVRDGAIIGAGEWQSKKARALLKILIARRGNPIARDELHGLLWPEDTQVASNRLSVVLTVLRTVLDGSRADKASGPAILSDRDVVRLDLSVVDVDVERYFDQANEALRTWRAKDANALEKLLDAAAAYTGEFCAEDAYESWAQILREDLTALHVSVLRALAAAARDAKETDLASNSLNSILRLDPHDESAYLDLVNISQEAGRYGDARRHYRRYADRMAEIGMRPEPFPNLRGNTLGALTV